MKFNKAAKLLLSLGTASSATLAVTVLKYKEDDTTKKGNSKMHSNQEGAIRSTWDQNWDHRDPIAMINPNKLQKVLDGGDRSDLSQLLEQVTPTSTRHLFFVRHGQYCTQEKLDENRKLTMLGQEQAICTGMRLKDLGYKYDQVVESSMTRAMETSALVQKQVKYVPVQRSDLLREGSPINPDPTFHNWRPERHVFVDGPRIESAFRKFVHRADPSQEKDSYEIIVCHANVIRYIVCRALQLPPEAWLRMSLKHGSITCLSIYPDGFVSLTSLGEAGHMPPEKLSS